MKTALYSFFIFLGALLGEAKALNAKGLDCSVRAKSAAIYNPDTGVFLYKKNFEEPYYPASVMKIATAAYVLDKGFDLNTLCPVTKNAMRLVNAAIKQANPLSFPPYILEHDGIMLWLKEGNTYSLEALLYGILLMSCNDAANVLAEGVSGSIEQFMEGLNHYLRDHGILHTRLQNPHGLHHPAQMTTAHDMALIGKLAFDNPQFLKIIQSPQFVGEGLSFENSNALLKKGKYRYEKLVGGKTGYIRDAGYNLVACAEDNGRRLILVLMGCSTPQERSEDAIALFETAFREKPISRLLFSKDQGPFLNKEKGWKGHLREPLSMTYYPSEETPIATEIAWYAKPRKKELGQLIVKNEGGIPIATAPLYKTQKEKKPSSCRMACIVILGLLGLYITLRRVILVKR